MIPIALQVAAALSKVNVLLVFSTPGESIDWTVPPGVGGGAHRVTPPTCGGGSGGGGFGETTVTSTEGDVFTTTVGAKGAGGSPDSDGVAASNTTVEDSDGNVICAGIAGAKGHKATLAGHGAGGLGGGGIGDVTHIGGNGYQGVPPTGKDGAGGGSSATPTADGENADTYRPGYAEEDGGFDGGHGEVAHAGYRPPSGIAGGAAGGGANATTAFKGADGGDGLCTISYTRLT